MQDDAAIATLVSETRLVVDKVIPIDCTEDRTLIIHSNQDQFGSIRVLPAYASSLPVSETNGMDTILSTQSIVSDKCSTGSLSTEKLFLTKGHIENISYDTPSCKTDQDICLEVTNDVLIHKQDEDIIIPLEMNNDSPSHYTVHDNSLTIHNPGTYYVTYTMKLDLQTGYCGAYFRRSSTDTDPIRRYAFVYQKSPSWLSGSSSLVCKPGGTSINFYIFSSVNNTVLRSGSVITVSQISP